MVWVLLFLLEVPWIPWIQILDDTIKGKRACKKKLQPNWRHNHLIKAIRCKRRIYKGWKKDLPAETAAPLKSGTVGIK